MSNIKTIAQAQQWGRLALSDSPSSAEDVRQILCHCLQQSSAYLMTWPERALEETVLQQFQALIEQRIEGQPVAYLLGTQGFWDLELEVSRDTLIPRSETEVLVELALSKITAETRTLLDLGTGTGAIALAVARECQQLTVTGVDFKPSIIALAERNQQRNDVVNCQFIESSWYQQLPPQRFDIIVSNPPYVEQDSEYLQQGDLRFEPLSALTAADNGLADITIIIAGAVTRLNRDGWLIIEHGFAQKTAVADLCVKYGFSSIRCVKDYAGLDRITLAQRKSV